MLRQCMLRHFGVGVALLACSSALQAQQALQARTQQSRPEQSQPRPNFLILIADDLSARHLGCYGDKAVKTPNIDRLARQGIRFRRAYTAAPTCTPSRAAILTGQAIHRLKEGGNLWGVLPAEYITFTELLARAGYVLGLVGKGWGPGSLEGTGRTINPAGPTAKNFREFLKGLPPDRPFCFWLGSKHPHRPYKLGSGIEAGIPLDKIEVPPIWPDTKEVRSDIADYYAAIQVFDQQVGDILQILQEAGLAEDTIVIILSDNGMPFPRGKANLYDLGNHMPLIVRWKANPAPGRTCDAFISYTDLAPTILEAAGQKVPLEMTGRSFLELLTTDKKAADRDKVFFERERHANVRKGDVGYPARALRTDKYLYIKNFRPQRWPAGDPVVHFAVGPFGDIDDGPTKQLLMRLAGGTPEEKHLFELSMGKRPAEELYDCASDPHQMKNLAASAEHGRVLATMRAELAHWMKATGDPRAAEGGGDDRWDRYKYYGGPAKKGN
jgi:arylsulfatase A-like enzyme